MALPNALVSCDFFSQIARTDVVVGDYLGEGAFSIVYKGTVHGPLRNTKLTPKFRQNIAFPVAIKFLRGKKISCRTSTGFLLLSIDHTQETGGIAPMNKPHMHTAEFKRVFWP